jgi:hypothetical protein
MRSRRYGLGYGSHRRSDALVPEPLEHVTRSRSTGTVTPPEAVRRRSMTILIPLQVNTESPPMSSHQYVFSLPLGLQAIASLIVLHIGTPENVGPFLVQF